MFSDMEVKLVEETQESDHAIRRIHITRVRDDVTCRWPTDGDIIGMSKTMI